MTYARSDDGVWELRELSEDIASPDAALDLRQMHVVLEAAAADFARPRPAATCRSSGGT